MPRHSKYREFLSTLYEISGAANHSHFARMCGKAQSQISSRMNGATVTSKFVQSCAAHMYGWDVTANMEIMPFPAFADIPKTSGIYVLYDSGGNILYVGKATNFRDEVRQTCRREIPVGIRLGPKLKKKNPKIRDLTHYISLYEISSARVRHNFESILLRIVANQTHNSNIGKAS